MINTTKTLMTLGLAGLLTACCCPPPAQVDREKLLNRLVPQDSGSISFYIHTMELFDWYKGTFHIERKNDELTFWVQCPKEESTCKGADSSGKVTLNKNAGEEFKTRIEAIPGGLALTYFFEYQADDSQGEHNHIMFMHIMMDRDDSERRTYTMSMIHRHEHCNINSSLMLCDYDDHPSIHGRAHGGGRTP